MPSKNKQKPAKARPPEIIAMTATGGTLLLPEVDEDQAVEVEYGYRFKGSWKPAQLVERLPGRPVCVTVGGLKTSKSYIFRARHQTYIDGWCDWSAASNTGKTSADLGAAVSAQVLAGRLASRYREHTGAGAGETLSAPPGHSPGDGADAGPVLAALSSDAEEAAPAPHNPSLATHQPQSRSQVVRRRRAALSGQSQRESDLATLMAMGFHAGLCETVLEKHSGDLQAAAEDLSSHPEGAQSSRAATTERVPVPTDVSRLGFEPEEAEPPPTTRLSTRPAESIPRSRLSRLELRTNQDTRRQEVPVEQEEPLHIVWRRLHDGCREEAQRLRDVVAPIILVFCTVKIGEVQIISVPGLLYLVVVLRDLYTRRSHTYTRRPFVANFHWTYSISMMCLLPVFVQRLMGFGDAVDQPGEAPGNGVSWIVWGWSSLCMLLQWIGEAFRWHPNASNEVANKLVALAQSMGDDDTVNQLNEGEATSMHHQLAAPGLLNPFAMWRKFWLTHPAGTFWYDHWIAAMIAACVICISCCSLLYSFVQSNLGIARLVRRILWAIRYWLKAIIMGSLASLVTQSGVEDYWLQSEYVLGYCVLWVGSVLWVATLDAISDALERPSTFTPGRVVVLFASIFVLGLPVLFWTAAHGIGWRIVSPVAVGVGVDGLGRAFLSRPLRDLAYLPIRLLSLIAECLESTVLRMIKDLITRLLPVLGHLWESREPCVAAIGSSYLLVRGLERFEESQVWTGRSYVVGITHTCIGVCGALLTAELLSKDNNGRPRLQVFCISLAVTCATILFLLTVALPRSIQWLYVTMSRWAGFVLTSLGALARYVQLMRMLRAAQAGLSCAVHAALDVFFWLSNRVQDLCTVIHRAVSAFWQVASQILATVWSILCRIASAVWIVACRVTNVVWATVRRILTATRSIASQTLKLLARMITVLQGVISTVCRRVGAILQPIWMLILDVGLWLWNAVATTLSSFARRLANITLEILAFVRNVVLQLGRAAWRPMTRVLRVIYRQFQRFTRAYWRLLPTGLAVQTCIRFGVAILRSPPPAASAALGFALAAIAVGIIAVILVRDLFMRTFAWSATNNRQYIATDRTSTFYVHSEQSRVDRMLLYVDLGTVSAARWAITNAGNVLQLLVEHGAAYAARALRWMFKQVWWVAQLIWDLLLLPALKRIKAVVLMIWESPLLSSAAALGSLWLLWAHHSGTWRWHLLERMVVTTTTIGTELFGSAMDLILIYGKAVADTGYKWASRGTAVMMAVLDSTTTQLVAAAEAGDIESPRLAWVVWIVIVIATKSQAEIRLKTLMWPFVVLWATALMGGAQLLPQVMVGVLCWCGAAAAVRNYEQRERDRVQNRWQQTQRQRQRAPAAQPAYQPPRPTGEPKEQKFKDQTECSICLEKLRDKRPSEANGVADTNATTVLGDPDAIELGMLPCGHCFHSDCIGQWLQREARCPLCRQAVHGIDRVLEIMF